MKPPKKQDSNHALHQRVNSRKMFEEYLEVMNDTLFRHLTTTEQFDTPHQINLKGKHMAFVHEIPSAEDIEKYELPYKLDLEKPSENRRMWTVDRERNLFLTGGGATGNPAFEDPKTLKVYFILYLSGSKFRIIMEPDRTPGDFNADPYCIHWPALLEIWAIRPQENAMVDVTKVVKEQPDVPHPMLSNYSFNEFVSIFKEALIVHKAGFYNRVIKAPITVTFGF